MKRFFGVLALVFGMAGTASAQSALRITPGVGSFAPMLPVISIDDGQNPDVELESAPAATLEFGYAPRSWATLYGGLTYTAPRLVLSGAMESSPANGASTRTNLLIPTAGVMLSRQLGRTTLRPALRLGLGVKSYKFDMVEQDDRVTNFTGDLGLGLSAGEGPVTMSAEARWLPSTFNARSLPIRSMGGSDQDQNDWVFQLGFRFRP
ncbi:MAG: hypothetical protein KY444_11650 [Gemmatimonadetes bacterium]|nr:hypothetical protein [Gemmatimonadota bacterium]